VPMDCIVSNANCLIVLVSSHVGIRECRVIMREREKKEKKGICCERSLTMPPWQGAKHGFVKCLRRDVQIRVGLAKLQSLLRNSGGFRFGVNHKGHRP